MKALDLPPLWLIGFAALAWVLGGLAPSLRIGGWATIAGMFLVAAGVVVTGLAVLELSRAGTTIVPGREPAALVTSGIFGYSRNPIYLADTLILTGLILYWNAALALPLAPVFAVLLRQRFILPEENRLAGAFPAEFESYERTTRRWI
ncbi:MAG: isoprenylcysteine carboxylmethyltransferase family protein [Rhodobacter sp.]|nr:isoprenylcysteine carboxylmethyltransferase family protein [Rhodobacter sp.]